MFFTRFSPALAVAGLVLALAASPAARAQEHEHAAMPHQVAPTTASGEASAEAAATNTMCPVMTQNPINRAVSVEYEGKTVYFCCAGCPAQFQAHPERYLSRLPQFGGTEGGQAH